MGEKFNQEFKFNHCLKKQCLVFAPSFWEVISKPWNVMPDRVSLFASEPWASGMVTLWPSKDLETEIRHVSLNHAYTMDPVPVKTLHTEAYLRFPGWQYSACTVIHLCQRSFFFLHGNHTWHFSWTLPYVPLSLVDFNLCPLPVINCEYNSF